MNPLRTACAFLALLAATAAFAADPTGTWQWSTHSAQGDIPTTLKLESKGGQLNGAYTNQFGATTISNAVLQGDVITFEIVRDLDGQKYVVHYRGQLAGDQITGTIEAPAHDGGHPIKLPWTAQRTPTPTPKA